MTIYARCRDCGKRVRLTGLFAGWHLCLTDEERAAKRRLQKAYLDQQKVIEPFPVHFQLLAAPQSQSSDSEPLH